MTTKRTAKPPATSRKLSASSSTRPLKFDTLIKGGNVVTPAGTFTGDVGISGEKISALGISLEADSGTKVIDASGHHVIPGVLDVHVHLELPFCGTVSADDYRSGTRAGARGGVTT
ncbi:MAG TPA: hypothetical protein VFH13_03825, partial [Gemmatimonadaceae bacterium]|nr:hypothetical protein [Gemmatimonadaceae bacterium]